MLSAPSINSTPPLSEEELILLKKRQRTRQIIGVVLFFVLALTSLEIYFLFRPATVGANNVTVVAIFNVLLILLFLLLILITRNLVKLYNERKSKILGSKFQTKLILAFLTLVLVPSFLLFFVASKLFSYTIGKWFSVQVEQSLKQSMDVAQEYYSVLEKEAQQQSRKIGEEILHDRLYEADKRPELLHLLSQKIGEYQISGVVLLDGGFKILAARMSAALPADPPPINYMGIIKDGAEGGASEIQKIHGHFFLVTVLPVSPAAGRQRSGLGYIAALTVIPSPVAAKIENIQRNFEEYRKQTLLKLPVTANYYITFLMITMLILFSAIWLGFYMARGITIPIQQLAEGTRKIAEGDMSFKIEVRANDEIGLLVDSFNKMMTEINENRKKIQQGNEELKHTNIELERRRNHIETILENIGAGVISISKKGQITSLNKAAKKILNIVDEADILGAGYREALNPAFHQPVRDIIRRLNEDQQESVEEQIELMAGENTLTLLVKINVLRDTGRKYLGLVIVFENLTQMIKAQKIAAWREVAQGIAHEIKNPLTPIQLNTQRLLKKFHENREDFARIFDESIRIIDQEVQGMKELLDEFLQFSRMPAPNPHPASLHKIIDSAALLYANLDKKISIRKNYDPNINLVNVDPEQFRRVFINLFENANDALNGKGEIEISTRLLAREKIIKIEFSDNGIGIPPGDRDKLFLPHFTTKKRGTGLGLAIVNRIIVDHNGVIQARDNHPKGTTFAIELPYSFPYASPAAETLSENLQGAGHGQA